MTDMDAGSIQARLSSERAVQNNASVTMMTLSALLIIAFPTLFWMGILEAANFLLSLSLTNATRLIVAAILISILGLIWAFITISGRQRL